MMKQYEVEFILKSKVKADSENEAIGKATLDFFNSADNKNYALSFKEVRETK